MAAYDFRAHRIFVDAALAAGQTLALERDPSHYLLNVLRMQEGDRFLVFNGRDGEFLARIGKGSKKAAAAEIAEQTRPQPAPGDLHYLFAPLKHARLDYMLQKAVEMGASRIQPVVTRHTQVSRVNIERMRANVVEAAEQCGVLCVPEVADEVRIDRLLGDWDPSRLMIFCDEDAEVADPLSALRGVEPGPAAILIGPEGGFSPEERAQLLRLPRLLRLSLGPRILRADTAAVAALALVQATLGDWRS
ncbi:ribosomal RNA small subunit methyltransferase E [Alsobacter metallidurans]|uniref:Ribosomal RNA small subunit methyltransferase E n=1 Tax=Alsobacter metallidurans TaxID=340221 RepID=A0A917I5A2_9HYPH|nr:16S rRNA (uracil(1498)-N(3))-methyltransferase [Alsobacter metallidurans]GGH11890.1 ribosomal RNA small subunit methyltransferase E [Alsobacter metallidurans]